MKTMIKLMLVEVGTFAIFNQIYQLTAKQLGKIEIGQKVHATNAQSMSMKHGKFGQSILK